MWVIVSFKNQKNYHITDDKVHLQKILQQDEKWVLKDSK